ncbi:MAG: DMT family transporter [Pseudomonadota bacterium]|nr:DMT family transporter [Pseudomonadota bacterium]
MDEHKSKRLTALILMASGSIAISFGGLLIRNIEQADGWQLVFYRAIGMLVSVSIILMIRYRRHTIFRIRDIGWPGVVGGGLVAIASISFVQSVTHTTVANSLFMLCAIPFISAALARLFLKEALTWPTIFTMTIAAIGVSVMLRDGFGGGSMFGNGMALLCALSFGTYAVIVRWRRQVDMLPVLVVSSTIILAAGAVVTGGRLEIPLRDFAICLLWGGVLSGFANWMFIIASRNLIAAEVTLVMQLEFVFGPIWVWLFINEVPTQLTILGGSLVLSAVLVRALVELRSSSRN